MLSRMIAIFFGVLLITNAATGNVDDANVDKWGEIQESVLSLHRSDNGRFMVWNECGKPLRGDGFAERANRYADLIWNSIRDVKEKTGFEVPYRDVVAVLFRESSHNECCIGKQEITKLSKAVGREPTKDEIIGHVKKWYAVQGEASKWCDKQPQFTSSCKSDYIAKTYPEYANILGGWDLGAAQYRYPNTYLRNRAVNMPDGKIVDKVGMSQLMQLDVTIQLLVEDLASYYETCKGHNHWLLSKWGHRVRKLSVDEAYFVHHHKGEHGWSWSYWKRMQSHFKIMDKMKLSSSKISLIFSRLLFGKLS